MGAIDAYQPNLSAITFSFQDAVKNAREDLFAGYEGTCTFPPWQRGTRAGVLSKGNRTDERSRGCSAKDSREFVFGSGGSLARQQRGAQRCQKSLCEAAEKLHKTHAPQLAVHLAKDVEAPAARSGIQFEISRKKIIIAEKGLLWPRTAGGNKP